MIILKEMSKGDRENLSLKAPGSGSESSNEEMEDLDDSAASLEAQANASMKSKSSNRSGRRPLPIRWTRVISLDDIEEDE